MDRPLIMATTGSSWGGSVQPASDPMRQSPKTVQVKPVIQRQRDDGSGDVMRSGQSVLCEGQVEPGDPCCLLVPQTWRVCKIALSSGKTELQSSCGIWSSKDNGERKRSRFLYRSISVCT